MTTRYYLITVSAQDVAVIQISSQPFVKSLWPCSQSHLRQKGKDGEIAAAVWLWQMIHYAIENATSYHYLIQIDDEIIGVWQIEKETYVVTALWPQWMKREVALDKPGQVQDLGWLWGMLHFLPPTAMQGAMRAGEN